MDLKRLEYYEAVSRLGSFTKAAEELRVAQPSITAAIKKLEEDLGIVLLVRDKRSVVQTYEGTVFREKAVEILKLVRQTEADMEKLREDAPHILNLGIPPVLGSGIMALLYGPFKTRYPEVRVGIMELGSYGILQAVDNGEIEMGFVVLADEVQERYHTDSVLRGEIHALMSVENSLAKQNRVPIAALENENLFRLPSQSYVQQAVDRKMKELQVESHVLAAPTQMISAFNLVAHNLGVTFVLGEAITVVNDLEAVTSRPLEPSIPFSAGFVWRKGKSLSKEARTCIRFVKENEDWIRGTRVRKFQ